MQIPDNLAQFRHAAETAFRHNNPEAIGIIFKWTRCERVRWHDGSPGFTGSVTVSARDYRTREFIATATDDAISVQ
jgi:hypothetical protein